jgi:hypothetical protein
VLSPHDREKCIQSPVEPAVEPRGGLCPAEFAGDVKPGRIALAARQREQRFLAAAPSDVNLDSTAVFDPVGQGQVVAGCDVQAFRFGGLAARKQFLEALAPGSVKRLQIGLAALSRASRRSPKSDSPVPLPRPLITNACPK